MRRKRALTLQKELTTEEEDMVNFTSSKTNTLYFQRNPMNIKKGILSLKVLDLLFKEMQFKDKHPSYQIRQYILHEDARFTLVQSMMLQNEDLTREILIFIQMHLSDHYSIFQMKETGMIEFLILCLNSTINGYRALCLLNIFQQVCISFNRNLKLTSLNSSDLKMLQDDKQEKDKIKIDQALSQSKQMVHSAFQLIDVKDIAHTEPEEE